MESAGEFCSGTSAVLSTLRGERSLTVPELADRTGLLPAAVRASVRELAVCGLVWRPVVGCEAGRWRLVDGPASG